MKIIQTLKELYYEPYYCGFIDVSQDISAQKRQLGIKLSNICKSEDPLSASEEEYKKSMGKPINCVIFKIPENFIIVDTDDEISETRIRKILPDDVVEKGTPSISRALGINMKKGHHYYFYKDEKFTFTGKKQFKDDILGNMDILGYQGKTAGYIIEHIDSVIPYTIDTIDIMYDDLYERITMEKYERNTPKKNNDVKSDTLEEKFKNVDVWKKWAELMPNENCTREEWLSVASFFKGNFEDEEGFEIFTIWSSKWWNYKQKDDMIAWRSIRRNDFTVGTMIYLLKKYSPENEKIWRDYVEQKSENYFISRKTIEGGIYDIAEVMHKEIKKKAIYCKDEWYIFNDEEKVWKTGKIGPTTIITKTIKKYFEWNITNISKKLQDSDDKEQEDFRKYLIEQKRKMDTASVCAQFTTHLKTLNCNDKFKNSLNNTKGKICYQNGIYDIESDSFREGIFYEDNLTFYLPFDYKKAYPSAKERVKKILMEINSMEEWKYEYYIKSLGYALTGYASKEQCAFFCIGLTAGNGKSTVFEALTNRMEGYVKKMKSDAFLMNNTKRHKFFADIDSYRILWINEIAKGQQDVELIKDLADGVPFQNEVVYGTEAKINMNSKLFFISNGEPKFASDNGIKRKYRYIQFQSKFFESHQEYEEYPNKTPNKHFIRDKTVWDFLISDEGITSLLEILYEGARMYFQNGLETPAIYNELKNEAIKANDIYSEFLEYFKESEGKTIHKSELSDMWTMSGCTGKFILEDCIEKMKTAGFIYDYKKQKKIAGKVKSGCFINMEFISEEDE